MQSTTGASGTQACQSRSLGGRAGTTGLEGTWHESHRPDAAVPTIDPGAWLRTHLTGEDADIDLALAMLGALAETLMSAQESMLCEGAYNERSDD
ncbi:MAG: hypothetical protein ACRDZW_10750 [Acidimicrobiales bacterium]